MYHLRRPVLVSSHSSFPFSSYRLPAFWTPKSLISYFHQRRKARVTHPFVVARDRFGRANITADWVGSSHFLEGLGGQSVARITRNLNSHTMWDSLSAD